MSITDELRGWANGFAMTRKHYELQLLAIADRIDAEHEAQLNDAFETRNSDENLESDGWVRLPVDADGEYIHIGDVMDGVDKYDSLKKVTGEVTTISFDATLDPDDSRSVGIRVWSDNHKSYHTAYLDPNASVYRHHHAPTVEDVLREMADRCYADEDEPRDRDAIVAEYAAKLQLREDA